jgi:hypothetical protein
MKVPFSGRCACGAISYECSAKPVFSWNCHCRDCQRAGGGGFSPLAYVSKAALTIRGNPKYHEVKAESGRWVRRGFVQNAAHRSLSWRNLSRTCRGFGRQHWMTQVSLNLW